MIRDFIFIHRTNVNHKRMCYNHGFSFNWINFRNSTTCIVERSCLKNLFLYYTLTPLVFWCNVVQCNYSQLIIVFIVSYMSKERSTILKNIYLFDNILVEREKNWFTLLPFTAWYLKFSFFLLQLFLPLLHLGNPDVFWLGIFTVIAFWTGL